MIHARVLADDATGALECGALLAASGFDPRIVVNLECRHASPEEASRRTLEAASGVSQLYVKTDSTLRGNIAAQLLALRRTRRVVYVPAYPKLGRVVRGGELLVDGVPVNQTAFAKDPFHPIRSASVARLFPDGHGIEIIDAECDEDLERLVIPLDAVLASPAGMIPHWALAVGVAMGVARRAAAAVPRVRRWMVVCGSLHPVSRRQALVARAAGVLVLDEGDAEQLAALAAKTVRSLGIDGVIVFGGDTASAVWRAFGILDAEPLGEVLSGVALSVGGGMVFVTKAGGFGGEDIVAAILEKLSV